MTNKEELMERLNKVSDKEYENFEEYSRCMFDFFWNEIEQIRKEDMERVEKDIKAYWDNKIYDGVSLGEVLSIIKQDEN